MDIMKIRDLMPSTDITTSPKAVILGAAGYQSLAANQAIGNVRAALSKEKAGSRDVYAVVLYGKHQAPAEFGYLKTVNAFFEAYWKGWRSLSRLSNLNHSSKRHEFRKINDQTSSDVCIYLGRTNARNVKDKMNISPGIYLIFSHLDASLLGSMGLPPVPEPFRESPVVVQFKLPGQPLGPCEDSGDWSPWKTLMNQVAVEHKAEEDIERNSLEWREDFMADYDCWTSTEVAKQSASTAKNVSAIASRWASEGKIFSVRFGGKTWFPAFQFQDGNPIPVVASVIETFSKHSAGWDLAFFFTSQNAYLAGRKPIELLKNNPARLESAAHAFVNPTDAF